MLNSFLWWLHDHALPLEVVLVILSGLCALYADTVRHFLSLPAQKLSTWILKARLLSVNSKLFNLCECHNNSFNTLVHIARAFVFLLLGEFLYRLRNFKGYDHYLMEHVAELEEKLVVAENSGASVAD